MEWVGFIDLMCLCVQTSQMEKLLAALSIPQVGAIRRLPSRPGERKPSGCNAEATLLLFAADVCMMNAGFGW